MQRRHFVQGLAALGLLSPSRLLAAAAESGGPGPVGADALPELSGPLTVYLGRGEGGLYDDVVTAIEKRNPALELKIRRAPSAALANTLLAESRAGVKRADLFWSIDASSLGAVAGAGLGRPVPDDILSQIKPDFRYDSWAAVSGRLRTVPYNPTRVSREAIPDDIMAFADSDLRIGWAPAYGAFQSFVTAMRLLAGEGPTRSWLTGVNRHAKTYAGELGVAMGVARGEVDVGFANHYYTLRLKQGQPDADLALALTAGDAGSLVNSSGVVLLDDNPLAANFLRYLLSREVQSYLAREAFEIPMVAGVPGPAGLPTPIEPPAIDLTRLDDLQPTLELLRETGVL
ncbi:ABC transporter substrate-binding protein [Salinisphaera orenii MK-B5]|uniref:ABC transporter substrate-binding protein n=1 Tax=Salinisphaera orenii MK-B5 TaxID=856730 RepID=A0A423PYA0_9GAMM|nr:substrate-binding domain-containing protein [Salinisphaera orenii]ROO30565.1 ABC transporter substrate-binding protein [Salinisphaera orenii MK-B5]